MSVSAPRLLVVSPVRNEAAHLERVVRAVATQQLAPARWVVVDDGSSDSTLEILRSLEPEVPFLSIVVRPGDNVPADVPDRLAAAAAPRAFNAGLATRDWRDFSHVMKLDGDVELPPEYLRVLLERFDENPGLGIAGGVLQEPTAGGMQTIATPRTYVHGALKCYTHECFEAIGGIQQRLGWDTIDIAYAQMAGFQVRSFPDLVATHHRHLGSADGVLRGRARHGECAYITHHTPLWVMLRAVKVATWRPRLLSGGAYLYGYAAAAARRTPRVEDPAYRSFSHRQQRRRLAGAVIPRWSPATGAHRSSPPPAAR